MATGVADEFGVWAVATGVAEASGVATGVPFKEGVGMVRDFCGVVQGSSAFLGTLGDPRQSLSNPLELPQRMKASEACWEAARVF